MKYYFFKWAIPPAHVGRSSDSLRIIIQSAPRIPVPVVVVPPPCVVVGLTIAVFVGLLVAVVVGFLVAMVVCHAAS